MNGATNRRSFLGLAGAGTIGALLPIRLPAVLGYHDPLPKIRLYSHRAWRLREGKGKSINSKFFRWYVDASMPTNFTETISAIYPRESFQDDRVSGFPYPHQPVAQPHIWYPDDHGARIRNIALPFSLRVTSRHFIVYGGSIPIIEYRIQNPGDAKWLIQGFLLEALDNSYLPSPYLMDSNGFSNARGVCRDERNFFRFMGSKGVACAVLRPPSFALPRDFAAQLCKSDLFFVAAVGKDPARDSLQISRWWGFHDPAAELKQVLAARSAARSVFFTRTEPQNRFRAYRQKINCGVIDNSDYRIVVFANRRGSVRTRG